MSQPHDRHADARVEFLHVLLQENASIDNDVLEVSQHTWMIHGIFPYDGQVPMAVFETYDEARLVLDEVCGFDASDER